MADIKFPEFPQFPFANEIPDTTLLATWDQGDSINYKIELSQLLNKISQQYSPDIRSFLSSSDNYNARNSLQINRLTNIDDADYSITIDDQVIIMNSITAARTITLPLANSIPAGAKIIIADLSGNIDGNVKIIIQRQGTDFIDNITQTEISTSFGSMHLISNGVDKWKIISSNSSLLLNSKTVTVGTGGDYANINEAMYYAQTLQPVNVARLTIQLLAGYTITPADLVNIEGKSLDFVSITSQDVNVPIDLNTFGGGATIFQFARGDAPVFAISFIIQGTSPASNAIRILSCNACNVYIEKLNAINTNAELTADAWLAVFYGSTLEGLGTNQGITSDPSVYTSQPNDEVVINRCSGTVNNMVSFMRVESSALTFGFANKSLQRIRWNIDLASTLQVYGSFTVESDNPAIFPCTINVNRFGKLNFITPTVTLNNVLNINANDEGKVFITANDASSARGFNIAMGNLSRLFFSSNILVEELNIANNVDAWVGVMRLVGTFAMSNFAKAYIDNADFTVNNNFGLVRSSQIVVRSGSFDFNAGFVATDRSMFMGEIDVEFNVNAGSLNVATDSFLVVNTIKASNIVLSGKSILKADINNPGQDIDITAIEDSRFSGDSTGNNITIFAGAGAKVQVGTHTASVGGTVHIDNLGKCIIETVSGVTPSLVEVYSGATFLGDTNIAWNVKSDVSQLKVYDSSIIKPFNFLIRNDTGAGLNVNLSSSATLGRNLFNPANEVLISNAAPVVLRNKSGAQITKLQTGAFNQFIFPSNKYTFGNIITNYKLTIYATIDFPSGPAPIGINGIRVEPPPWIANAGINTTWNFSVYIPISVIGESDDKLDDAEGYDIALTNLTENPINPGIGTTAILNRLAYELSNY